MILRGGEDVDNKVSGKKYDKKERLKTNETYYEIKRDSPHPSNVSDLLSTSKPRVPYPQALNVHSLQGKTNTEMTY